MPVSLPLDLDLSADQLWGYLACALVLATFAMRSMERLRYVAIVSNVAFIYYAGALGLIPIVVLHAILLPLNILRLFEIWSETPMDPDEADEEPTGIRRVRIGSRG